MISISKINNKTSFGSYKLGEGAVKLIKNMSEMKSPAQRAVIGATAFILQPLIDSMNKGVDKKTRETAMARSLSKGIVCTGTGIIIRDVFIKIANDHCKKGKAFFIDALNNASKTQKGNYINAIGTGIALLAMLITNFAIDAPLTNVCQNWITKHIFRHNDEQNKASEVQQK